MTVRAFICGGGHRFQSVNAWSGKACTKCGSKVRLAESKARPKSRGAGLPTAKEWRETQQELRWMRESLARANDMLRHR